MIGQLKKTPTWLAAWCAEPFDLSPRSVAQILDEGRRSEKARAHMLRFPPGAVVRCLCGRVECIGFGIVINTCTIPEPSVTLTSGPEDDGHRYVMTGAGLTPLVTVGFSGAWTPAAVGYLLDGLEAGG